MRSADLPELTVLLLCVVEGALSKGCQKSCISEHLQYNIVHISTLCIIYFAFSFFLVLLLMMNQKKKKKKLLGHSCNNLSDKSKTASRLVAKSWARTQQEWCKCVKTWAVCFILTGFQWDGCCEKTGNRGEETPVGQADAFRCFFTSKQHKKAHLQKQAEKPYYWAAGTTEELAFLPEKGLK